MIIVVVLSLPFLVVLLRKPVLRRLAVRNAVRRPREAILILLGAMLGTAIITSSYVVGDTLGSSIRHSAFTQLGPADEVVVSTGIDNGARVAAAVASRPLDGVDGTLSLLTLTASVASTGPQPKAEPHAQVVEVDFANARDFGGTPSATGITGATPVGDEAVITTDLATTVDAKVGDHVSVYAYGAQRDLRVSRIVKRYGIAGFRYTGQNSQSPNIFVAPGTIAALQGAGGQRGTATQTSPPTAVLAVSNSGSVLDGVTRTDAVKAELDAAIAGLPASVQTVKRTLLDDAKTSGQQFTTLFQSIGWFSVLAGILLLVNIFVMLAQERKTELGMLRAVGLRRASLVGSFSLEGWLYALASSLLGSVVGLGIGRVIVVVASGIFDSGGRFSLELHFAATARSLQAALGVGFAIALITVLLTSLSIARLNVIRAIRDLPEPASDRRNVLRLVLGALASVVGALMTVAGIAGAAAFPALAGPAVLGLGLVPLLRRWVPPRPLITVVSAAVLAWAVVVFEIVKEAFRDGGIGIFVTQGVILTAAAVALVTQNQSTIGAVIKKVVGGSSNKSLRLGLAYPLARRFRTGLILSMYALVVFTLTFITVLSHLFGGQVTDFTRKISGGAAVRVPSNPSSPVPVEAVQAMPDVTNTSVLLSVDGEFANASTKGDFKPWDTAGFDEIFIGHGAPQLSNRGTYPDDASAYRAVLADPGKMIVSRFFLERGGGGPPSGEPKPGQIVTMRDPQSGATKQMQIAAISESGFGNALTLLSRQTAVSVFGARATPNLIYVTTKAGTDNDRLADEINGQFIANGADATSFRHDVADNVARQQQFFQLIEGYLALGLLVGVAGLGVVMVRAVRERRREIGVLRSLGFSRVAVRRAFVAESAFVAFEGIVIGAALAIVTAWRTVGSGAFGTKLGFSVPWVPLLALLAGTFVASLIATAAPAMQASRIRPAVALRIAD
jgi:putative ABC transport system permease protein